MSRWRTRARSVIDRTVREWLAERHLPTGALSVLMPLQERSLLEAVSAAYPFGERAAYPYKAWLLEVQELRKRMPGYVPQRQPEPELADQRTLEFSQ